MTIVSLDVGEVMSCGKEWEKILGRTFEMELQRIHVISGKGWEL